jgi:hypothetical protein
VSNHFDGEKFKHDEKNNQEFELAENRSLTGTYYFYFNIVITAYNQSPPLQKTLQDFATQFIDWITTFAISG